MRRPPGYSLGLGCYLGAVAAAAATGICDLRQADLQIPVVIAGGAAFALGYLQPRHAWPLAAVIGAGVPVAHWLVRGGPRTPSFGLEPVAILLSFVPAVVGASTALGLRKLIAAHRGSDDEE